ncbi:MAG TPA: CCA tRNA nucleotidyltransferase [Thermoplasmata archaeon]|nr:CCA tRNA nucleotidyltransferase [Thermoplasmata archaeon]
MAAPNPDDARTAAVEEAVTARLEPSQEFVDRLARTRDLLVERARAIAQEQGIPLERALVAGSAARGTFLNDRLDVDLFLLFPLGTSRERLVEGGLAIGRALLERPILRYAEHPYLRGEFGGFAVETVPGYAVADPGSPVSAVDRTPFHQEYLAQRQTPEMVREVRLAKSFLRRIGAYGSEARTAGFSGYLVELLVLRFGTFRALLRSARGWRLPAWLDPAAPTDALRVPEDVALVLLDPVDPDRNVASALSRRNLARFVLAADAYLQAPEETAFGASVGSALTAAAALDRVRARGTHVASVRFDRPELVDDILYPQLRKAERALAVEVDRLGFTLLGSASAAGTEGLIVLLETAEERLSTVEVRRGPPAGIDRGSEFLRAWRERSDRILQGPYVTVQGELAVDVRRAETALVALLTEALPRLSLGKNLQPLVARAQVGRLEPTTGGDALPEALAELLDKRLPWEASTDRGKPSTEPASPGPGQPTRGRRSGEGTRARASPSPRPR